MKKRVAVFGAGLSGQSAADLVISEGYSVTVFDQEKAGFMKEVFGRRLLFELRAKVRVSFETLPWSALIFIPQYLN